MSAVATQQTAVLRPQDQASRRERYGYVSGLIRALEIKLLDNARINRLLEARSVDEIGRILSECGYPVALDPEISLKEAQIADFRLIQSIMPESGWLDVWLVLHDGHNLKVILKHLIPNWLAHKGAADRSEDLAERSADELPEFSEATAMPFMLDLESRLLLPAETEPAVLGRGVAERLPEKLPAWLYRAAVQAVHRYQSSYDISDIDAYLDRSSWQEAHRRAGLTGNTYLANCLQYRTDLINIELLLRTRVLRAGSAVLTRMLLPGGSISPDRLIAWYGEPADIIAAALEQTRYAPLAAWCEQYGVAGQAARFSLAADNLYLEQVRTARWITNGPEIPLAWLMARQMEIKNIRIILTCVRNNLPPELGRDLIRKSYLTWR